MATTINRKRVAISALLGFLVSIANAEQSANGLYNSQQKNGNHYGQVKNGSSSNLLQADGIVEIPEPGTLALLGAGITTLLVRAFFRRREK